MDDTFSPPPPQPRQQPVPISSSAVKEHEPETISVEPIQPSEKEPSLDKEVAETGVETVSESPQLSYDQKKAGVDYARENVPVSTTPSANIVLPMTEEEAIKIIKTTNISDSKHWLAVLIERIFQQIKI
ncbi:MAG: hypothetical protein Q7S38_01745 [bacterium]|nr:hypothetical protein [bacterium]